jgi:hypothetical protein
MLQVLHLDVAKVDRVLHLPSHFLLPRLGVSFRHRLGIHPLPFFLDTGDIRVGMKTDRIRTDITDITFVFIFLFGFGLEYE